MKDQNWIEYSVSFATDAGQWLAVRWEATHDSGQVLVVAGLAFALIMAALRWRAWRILTAPVRWLLRRKQTITFNLTPGMKVAITQEANEPEPRFNGTSGHLKHVGGGTTGKTIAFKDHLDPNAEPEAVYEEYEVAEASLGSEGGTIRRVPGGFQITQNTPAADDIALTPKEDGPPARHPAVPKPWTRRKSAESEPMLKPVTHEYEVGDRVRCAKTGRLGTIAELLTRTNYRVRFDEGRRGYRCDAQLEPEGTAPGRSTPYAGSKPAPSEPPVTQHDLAVARGETSLVEDKLGTAKVRIDYLERALREHGIVARDNYHELTRDPRKNPKALDVVDTGSVIRTVTYADEFGVCYTAEDQGGYKVHQEESLTSWRRRCSNGTVVKRAQEPDIDEPIRRVSDSGGYIDEVDPHRIKIRPERDPRRDPMPGDVLRGLTGYERRVTKTGITNGLRYVEWVNVKGERKVATEDTLETWRKSTRNATIIRQTEI